MNRHPLRYPNGSIILFAKAPVAGAVKTRLAADIGTAAATRLYRTLLRNTAQLCSEACLTSVELHVAMNVHHPLFVSLAKQLDILWVANSSLSPEIANLDWRSNARCEFNSVPL